MSTKKQQSNELAQSHAKPTEPKKVAEKKTATIEMPYIPSPIPVTTKEEREQQEEEYWQQQNKRNAGAAAATLEALKPKFLELLKIVEGQKTTDYTPVIFQEMIRHAFTEKGPNYVLTDKDCQSILTNTNKMKSAIVGKLALLLLMVCLFTSCGTVFGGKITKCQQKGNKGHRQVSAVVLVADIVLSGPVGVVIDFCDGHIYKKCDTPKK